MNQNNEQSGGMAKDALKQADNFVGNKVALASNKVAPLVGPIVTKIVWKHKEKIALFFTALMCFACFGVQSIAYNMAIDARSYLEQIPSEHKDCIQKAKDKYKVEFELIAAFGQAISDFKTDHVGSGKGFLEISEEDWTNFSADGNDNGTISELDVCDNYFTIANKLSTLTGSAEEKIDIYNHPKKEQIKQVYKLFTGLIFIPYGNPVGLTRSDLVIKTSGYDETRLIDGVTNVHTGVDVVPSDVWYSENPGKSNQEAINRSIILGTITNFQDSYGALCSYVANTYYRILYCHCSAHLAENNSDLKYGDPVCLMGTTGFSTGVHTHVEVFRKGESGSWDRVDPTPFLFPNTQ
jgi:hypothetical protein